jgi:hypothetical protein
MSAERNAVAGTYPIRFKPKTPGAALDYTLDFSAMILDAAPATLLGVAWSIVAIAGDATPLAIVAQSLTGSVSVVRLSGGVALESYSVRGQCSWSDGETSVVSFVLPIDYAPNRSNLFPLGIASAELFGIPTII